MNPYIDENGYACFLEGITVVCGEDSKYIRPGRIRRYKVNTNTGLFEEVIEQ